MSGDLTGLCLYIYIYIYIYIYGGSIMVPYTWPKRDSNLVPKPLSLLEFETWWPRPLGHHSRFFTNLTAINKEEARSQSKQSKLKILVTWNMPWKRVVSKIEQQMQWKIYCLGYEAEVKWPSTRRRKEEQNLSQRRQKALHFFNILFFFALNPAELYSVEWMFVPAF